MNWADDTKCTHGMPFSQECDHCEIVGLKESLAWMTREVASNEKKLKILQDKVNPLNTPKGR